jgi:hypothetical protein
LQLPAAAGSAPDKRCIVQERGGVNWRVWKGKGGGKGGNGAAGGEGGVFRQDGSPAVAGRIDRRGMGFGRRDGGGAGGFEGAVFYRIDKMDRINRIFLGRVYEEWVGLGWSVGV